MCRELSRCGRVQLRSRAPGTMLRSLKRRRSDMRLADFILSNVEPILAEWERFARSLSPGAEMNIEALRDHAEAILRSTARDMVSPQTARQQSNKSKGLVGGGSESATLDSASKEHAIGRLASGFNLIEVVSEYQALRAS